VKQWCKLLIKRFKETVASALTVLEGQKYTTTDARNGRSTTSFIQNVLRHAKSAGIDNLQGQLTWAWTKLAPELRVHVPTPTENTTLGEFIRLLDERQETWQSLYKHGHRSYLSGLHRGRTLPVGILLIISTASHFGRRLPMSIAFLGPINFLLDRLFPTTKLSIIDLSFHKVLITAV